METVALIYHILYFNFDYKFHTYFRKRNTNTVAAMATSEMDTPIYPIICNDKVFCGERSRGRALSKMAK